VATYHHIRGRASGALNGFLDVIGSSGWLQQIDRATYSAASAASALRAAICPSILRPVVVISS
jgi:hypothetical protein